MAGRNFLSRFFLRDVRILYTAKRAVYYTDVYYTERKTVYYTNGILYGSDLPL